MRPSKRASQFGTAVDDVGDGVPGVGAAAVGAGCAGACGGVIGAGVAFAVMMRLGGWRCSNFLCCRGFGGDGGGKGIAICGAGDGSGGEGVCWGVGGGWFGGVAGAVGSGARLITTAAGG